MPSYCIYGGDNDSYAFRDYPKLTAAQKVHQAIAPDMSGDSLPRVLRCDSCAELLDKWNQPLPDFVVKKRAFDISHTYDGVTAVSERFKATCESARLSGLVFRQLAGDTAFYAIRPERMVEYDANRRGTRFVNQCPQCGCYESVVGATPVYLKPGVYIGDQEFVRTDLEFGSVDEKSPLLLCGESAAMALESANLVGLEMEPIVLSAPPTSA